MERRDRGKKRVLTEEAIRRFAVRSTRASAQLERRALPADYKRTVEVELFLAKRQPQA